MRRHDAPAQGRPHVVERRGGLRVPGGAHPGLAIQRQEPGGRGGRYVRLRAARWSPRMSLCPRTALVPGSPKLLMPPAPSMSDTKSSEAPRAFPLGTARRGLTVGGVALVAVNLVLLMSGSELGVGMTSALLWGGAAACFLGAFVVFMMEPVNRRDAAAAAPAKAATTGGSPPRPRATRRPRRPRRTRPRRRTRRTPRSPPNPPTRPPPLPPPTRRNAGRALVRWPRLDRRRGLPSPRPARQPAAVAARRRHRPRRLLLRRCC